MIYAASHSPPDLGDHGDHHSNMLSRVLITVVVSPPLLASSRAPWVELLLEVRGSYARQSAGRERVCTIERAHAARILACLSAGMHAHPSASFCTLPVCRHIFVPATVKELFNLTCHLHCEARRMGGAIDDLLLHARRTDAQCHLPEAPPDAVPWDPPPQGTTSIPRMKDGGGSALTACCENALRRR